jgi:ABC-type transport system involved in cytochrome c biogenesis permease subunit
MYRILYIIIAVLCIWSKTTYAQRLNISVDQKNWSQFAKIAILHEGRIKPLDSFARFYLTIFSGKENIGDLSASQWLGELLFAPRLSYQRKIFNITNPDVVTALKLDWSKEHRFSFEQLSRAFLKQQKNINLLYKKPPSQLSLAQNQLLDLYVKTLAYYQISRSLSLLLPSFQIENKEVAQKFNVTFKQKFSYFDILPYKNEFADFVSNAELESKQKQTLVNKINALKLDDSNNILKIIPVEGPNLLASPWEVLEQGFGSTQTNEYFLALSNLAIAYQDDDLLKWQENIVKITLLDPVTNLKVKLEYIYNNQQLLKKSLLIYILSFLIILLNVAVKNNIVKFNYLANKAAILYKLSIWSLITAFAMHLISILLRIFITGRPPVSTLYESIIFVSLIVILIGLFIEYKNKNNIGLLLGLILGIVLQFIGIKYASNGDTMQVLTAVLNNNFWLSTHVLTITIGYGFCLILGSLGHFFLIKNFLILLKFYKGKITKTEFVKQSLILSNTVSPILYISIFSLFFALLGTILGGIWADQSWGRFWGWDPKENGALLIVLWIIWILHGKIANIFNDLALIVTIALTNIIVAISWFGVNLLQIGLHSYGFTSNIATNLMVFCISELIIVFGLALLILKYQKKIKPSL